ncbi:hypothetical protein [Massilia eurypsychrophila]|jgi:hypothetical protein|nr:hypothetical protein [Massilia eurypsychrophila]
MHAKKSGSDPFFRDVVPESAIKQTGLTPIYLIDKKQAVELPRTQKIGDF